MLKTRAILATTMIFSIIICLPAAFSQSEDDEQAIREVHELHHQALNAGDAQAHASYFTDDAVLMPPNEPAVVGKAAILSWDQATFQIYTVQLSTVSIDRVIISGDSAITQSTYSAKLITKGKGNSVWGENKSIHVYKKQADGSWKIVYDIWSNSGPLSYAE